jgi:hypothetical protein
MVKKELKMVYFILPLLKYFIISRHEFSALTVIMTKNSRARKGLNLHDSYRLKTNINSGYLPLRQTSYFIVGIKAILFKLGERLS